MIRYLYSVLIYLAFLYGGIQYRENIKGRTVVPDETLEDFNQI